MVRLIIMVVALFVAVVATSTVAFPESSFPRIIANSFGSSPCLQQALPQISDLVTSTDMLARTAQTYLSLPFEVIADYILNPSLLATWNGDYSSGGPQTQLPICQKLLATFTTKINVTVPAGYSFKPPIILTVNRTNSVALFGWQFGVSDSSGNNLYYGAHWIGAFKASVNGGDAVLFISWEKIFGKFVAVNRNAFEYGLSRTVLKKDIDGGLCLDQVYSATGALDPAVVPTYCGNNTAGLR